MAWDPALLRKYNTTGHFRLLNQVRAELKEQPIQRPLVTSRTAAAAGSGGSAGGGGGSRRGAGRTAAPQTSNTHALTRRRGGSSMASSSFDTSSHDAEQPIMAVPVLTDVVLPDSHTEG